MVLGDQITVEINQPCTDGVRAEGRNEDSCPVSAELHQPRRPPARRLTGCVFMDKTKVGQGRQPVSNDRPAIFAGLFDGEPRVRTAEPDQSQNFGQTGDNGFFRPRSLTFVCLHRFSRVLPPNPVPKVRAELIYPHKFSISSRLFCRKNAEI